MTPHDLEPQHVAHGAYVSPARQDCIAGHVPDMPGIPIAYGWGLKLGPHRFGTLWYFAEVGQEIPEHLHTEQNVHTSVVMSGSVLYREQGQPERRLDAPAIIETHPGVPHSFLALVAPARVLNIRERSSEDPHDG